jgi:aryl-alcohol dehydrogenase-like predicted oxidoreductase
LVLGGASLGKMTQVETNLLLLTASECGIRRIDTAPGYGESEKRIGSFLKGRRTFVINTKVGLPDPSVFTPEGIRRSVENSLKDLGIEQVGTLFIHSLDQSYLRDENIDSLIRLKMEGKIARVGYSGDGADLAAAVRIGALDDFMAIFNIIDQANEDRLKGLASHEQIYFKIPLAQAVWSGFRLDRRLASLKMVRETFHKPPLPDTWLDYKTRFARFRGAMSNNDYAAEFLKFALFSGSSQQQVVLGTTSPQHVQDAVHIESFGPNSIQISKYVSLWRELSSVDWKSHN